MKYWFILFISVSSLAQSTFSESYYPDIDRAELAVIQKDYNAAIEAYNTAFSKVKKPLARDLYNVAMCKILLNDVDGAKPYLLKIASKGVPIDFIEKTIPRINWTEFKPIYNQISQTFVRSISEEEEELLLTWNNRKPITRPSVIFREGITITNPNAVSTTAIEKNDGIEARMKLESLLDSSGGYSEEEDNISDSNLLFNSTNTIVFSKDYGVLNFHAQDSTILEFLNRQFNYTPQLDRVAYIVKGIEEGKWHRDIVHHIPVRVLKSEWNFQIAEVKVEEYCGGIFTGYFIKSAPKKDKEFSFAESYELQQRKIIYHLKEEESDFLIGKTPDLEIKHFATCKTAKEHMKDWERVNL